MKTKKKKKWEKTKIERVMVDSGFFFYFATDFVCVSVFFFSLVFGCRSCCRSFVMQKFYLDNASEFAIRVNAHVANGMVGV